MNGSLNSLARTAGLGTLLAVFCPASALFAQPTLQIISPADGAVVSPGQTITVNVAVSGSVEQVSLIGEGPLGTDQVLSTAPYSFTIEIPSKVSPRNYTLTAVGVSTQGQPLYSNIISLDIERSDTPLSVSAQPFSLTLLVGGGGFLSALAAYADGTTAEVTQSKQTAYASDTTSVATVDSVGRVTAVGPGSAIVTISFNGHSALVPVTVRQPVRVVPTTATLNPSKSEQFYAQLAMLPGTDLTVTWSIHPALGSVDGTGLYTAPSAVDSEKRVVVTATSVADPTKSGSADVVLLPPISVSVDPVSANLSAGATQYFNATVVNALDPTVNWSVSPTGIGAVDRRGNYTAPGTIAAPQTVTVTATSEADNSKTASAQIALVPSIALSAGPASVTLYASQTQQFSATLSYTSYSGVTWSLSPNVGTIDWNGLYTAPALVAYQQTVTATATTGEGFKATVTITLVPHVSPSVTPPTGLYAAAVSATEIDLSWAPSTEAGGTIAGYCIYRNGALAGTSTTTSYTDLGLVSSTSYTYTVLAYDATGTNSAPSASVSAATPAGTPVPGLVASYSFAEGSGTVVHDSSGNGNNGVITGATWTAQGRLTNALQFDGKSSWVTVPDSSSLDLTTGMTLEAWVNAALPAGWQAVIVKEQAQDLCYGLFLNNSWPAANLFAGAEQPVYGNQRFTWNSWVHLAVTYDGATENLYLNGVLVGSTPVSGPMATSSQPLRIGGDSVWGQYFSGMIEEVSIYNRALSPTEIQAGMQSPGVTVSPVSATLSATQTQQFSAALTNVSSSSITPVTWSISPSVGTIDASGLYTAPAVIPSDQTVTVTATVQGDYFTTTATAAVTLVAQTSASISAPQGLTATTSSCSAVNLSWTASTEAGGTVAGYYILRNGMLVATSAATSYSDLGLVASTTYAYAIVAYDAQGYVSARSASASATTPSVVPAPGLVAYYNFEEGAGTAVHDSSCNGNNGVITGATWTSSGMAGGALVFNGSGNWVEVPDPTSGGSLDLTTGMTVEAWVNPASLIGDSPIIEKELGLGDLYGLYASSSISNTPAGLVELGEGGHWEIFGPAGLPLSAWTHLAATYDGATEKLFVNGVQVASEPHPGSITSHVAPLHIGGRSDGGPSYVGSHFAGVIDEVRVYNRPLSGTEIQSDMQLPALNITVSPASVELSAFGTQQFTSNTAVTWALSPAVGMIDGSGLYVAPPIVAAGQAITVTATSQINSAVQASATITLVPLVSSSIPAPQSLTASAVSASEVDLAWDASAEPGSVAGYLIFRDGTQIGISTTAAYVDLGVACAGSYTYTVAAYDSVGNNSAQSASATATTSIGSPSGGLVAYYNFNEGTGTVVHDCSGNGNDGVINEASWSSSGKWGGGLAVDNDNWVTVPDSSSLELTSGMTLEAWVNPTYLGGTLYAIAKGQLTAANGDVPLGPDYDLNLGMMTGSAALVANAELRALGGGYVGDNVPLSTWTHLAVTYDGTNVNGFVNGVLTDTTPARGTMQKSSYPLVIGLGAYQAGSMDEVRIYSRALTQGEIQSDMENAAKAFAIPGSVTLHPAQPQQFTAEITRTGSAGVTWSWSLSPTISGAPFGAQYTAPESISTQQTVTVTATSLADPAKSATAQITLMPPVAVSISPAASILYASQPLQLSAIVTNASNTAVNWWVDAGTIDGSGLYTPPATSGTAQIVTVTARSQADYSKTATATITVMPLQSSSISVPGGLTATAVSAAEIGLSWSASAEAGGSIAGYNILRNGIPIGTSSTTSYSDLGLLASTTYTYTVAAYDLQGNSSALAAGASATTQAGIPGLVAYYTFNEGAGTVANDWSGNGNNGAITDAVWTTSGEAGSALMFNGTSSWVEVPDSSTLDLTTAMTLEAWVNMAPSASQDGWVDILVKEQDQQICYGLFSTSSGDWPAGDLFVGGEQIIYGPTQIPPSTWTHAATTYDGTTQSLYVNGVLVASRPQAGAVATAPNPLHIGGDSIWGEYFTGMIDEVRIYNRALSQAEIQTDMQAAVTITVSPATATLYQSQTQQFAAVVAGSGNTAVTWSVALGPDAPTGAQPGAVSPAGMYTPPSSVLAQYTVVVAAQSQANPTKSGSAIVTLIPSAPAAPTGLTATAGNATVSLTWSGSTGATSYTVYRGTTSGGETSLATGITGTSYTDSAVTNGTPYYYKVAAVNAGGTSAQSNEVSATPANPSTTTTASASATYSASSQAVTLRATVTSPAGTVNGGTVTFTVFQGSTQVGSPVVSGTVSSGTTAVGYTLPAATARGNYTIQAAFSGGSSFAASTSAAYVWVADTYNHRIQQFTLGGTWQAIIPNGCSGSSIPACAGGASNGQFYYPWATAVDSSGNIWVADTFNYRLQKFNSSGVWQLTVGAWGTGNGQFINPESIAIDSSDNVWVGENSITNCRVQKFNSSGVYQATYGSYGTGNGHFGRGAKGVAVDSAGNIWVADAANNRVQKLSSSGAWQRTIPSSGCTGTNPSPACPAGTGNGQFYYPIAIGTDSSGNIWVSDSGNYRVQKFNGSGVWQMTLPASGCGTSSPACPFGSGNGQFGEIDGNPVVDGSGNILVPDESNLLVQTFNSSGVYQSQFGIEGGGNGQFEAPEGMAISRGTLTIK